MKWTYEQHRIQHESAPITLEQSYNQQKREKFPPMPKRWVPTIGTLMRFFLEDYKLNKKGLLLELKAVTTKKTVSLDH